MPVTVFNPLAAVIVHSQVPVNPLTFQMLEGEEALLVHSCRRQATRQEWRRFNRHGKLIVFVRHSPLLTYSVRATALDPTGENLGNYHPGRCLSDRSLAFLNGGRTPFQFEAAVEGAIPGKLILLNPSQEPGAGDATEVDFTIEHAFVDIDIEEYPGGSVATPSEPALFITLPEQNAAGLTTEARDLLPAAVFHNIHPLGSSPLTLTLYYGDPASGGIAVSDPLPLAVWTAADEPDVATRTRLRNHAALEFLDASGLDRTVTHLLWARNGIAIARKALDAPIVIPGYYGLRVPIHALALQLTWPHAGDLSAWSDELPARVALRYLFGETLEPSQTALYVTCFDGDPHTTGNAIADNGLILTRDAGGFTLTGAAVASAAPVNGADPAPVGGWSIPFVAVGINDVQTWWIVKEFSPPLFVPEGYSVSISAGDLAVTIS